MDTEKKIAQEEFDAFKPESGYIAIVKKFDPSGSGSIPVQLEWIQARTKFELTQKLADPMIEHVFGLVRGRRLGFKESRRVTF